MRRITHNAHVFIIRPFVQLFGCSLVLFCFVFFLLLVRRAFCFVFLWVCFFPRFLCLFSAFALLYYYYHYYFDSVTFVGLVYLLLPISFLFRNVVVFSVLLFFLCYFALASLLFFSFPFLFFAWSAFNSSLFSQICCSFSFYFPLSPFQSHSFRSVRTITCMRRMWIDPFALLFPLGISGPLLRTRYTRIDAMLTMPSTDECITFLCSCSHKQTWMPINSQQIKCEIFRLQLRMQ